MRLRMITVLIFVFAIALTVSGGAIEPITGAAFDSLIAAQDTLLQRELDSLLADVGGCYACGPIDPLYDNIMGLFYSFGTTRLICINRAAYATASRRLNDYMSLYTGVDLPIPELRYAPKLWEKQQTLLPEQSGHSVSIWAQLAQLCTVQQNRYLVWLNRVVIDGWTESLGSSHRDYENSIYQYLMSLGTDSVHTPPEATEYNLPAHFDLYAEPPDYVIQGYQNYKDYLHAHAELTTEFASGITAFAPTTATLDWMKENAPREAHPNKEAAALQHEYRKFFERGGDTRIMQTLTHKGFDSLKSGEYFFAVGLNGTIRFGRELLREEVARIEKETGRKVPRANHAFLFPGEPVLTAGAFFIDERADQKLVKVNAQSGHYFYSNISETIRDDIAIRSDHYLLTLGHFFIALDRLSIKYDGILISKL